MHKGSVYFLPLSLSLCRRLLLDQSHLTRSADCYKGEENEQTCFDQKGMFWLRLEGIIRGKLGIRIEWKWGEIGNTGPASFPRSSIAFFFARFSSSEKRDRGDSFRWEYISRFVEYTQETTVGAKDFSICRNSSDTCIEKISKPRKERTNE